jgi:two-component system, NtrC family, sensor kinase
VVIADNGCGIPEEIQQRIFDPFFTTLTIGSGTGLGLSICQDIVARHGGELLVESALGCGTTMTVKLARNNGLGKVV